jgi:hypothetical protein
MEISYRYQTIKIKIREKISSLKNKIEKFKYDENNPHYGLELFESILTSRFIIASNSLADYVLGRKIFKRKVIAWSFNLLLWILVFRSLIYAIWQNKYYEQITGGTHYLYFRSDLLAFIISFLFATLAVVGKVNI